ncbi:MAG: hypothetical protein CM1200mP7_0330 [Chloroflexota bacterium]|nr:MAG: hypothetical protein CM1200mP7_0330 [Chloroflexota bacterium]
MSKDLFGGEIVLETAIDPSIIGWIDIKSGRYGFGW